MSTQNPPAPTPTNPIKPDSSIEPQSRSNGESVSKRLQKELMELMMNSDTTISAFPQNDNLFIWLGTITGPPGTVFSDMVFKIKLEFGESYPFDCPTCIFVAEGTSIPFHPNIDPSGQICLDILTTLWSPSYSVYTLLLSLQSLLGEPNCDSPLNVEAAGLWKNQKEYERVNRKKYEEGQR